MRDYLERGLRAMGLTPPDGAIDRLLRYSERLLEQNKVMNLTAITEPLKVAQLHFLDSASLLTHCDLRGARLIDVGTGAGFPGLVLKILEPSLQLTLLDSLQKRLLWLKGLCQELGFTDVDVLHGRAEDLSHDLHYRNQFAFATARAVAALPILCELCLPFVRTGGAFWAMKTGKESAEELEATMRLIPLLGGTDISVFRYSLPDESLARCLLRIEKSSPTPADYPRKWAKIKRAKF